MTNEEIIAKMWEAYKAGLEVPIDTSDESGNFVYYYVKFKRWLAENFPDLLEEPTKSREVYWHEFDCTADVHTPSGVGMCSCDGKHPDGTYDHDLVCNARNTTPIDGEGCSCVERRTKDVQWVTTPSSDNWTGSLHVNWIALNGNKVVQDEVIAEVDSDKATFELVAEKAGVLHVLQRDGEYSDNTIIGYII